GDEVQWTNQGGFQHTVTANIAGQPPFDAGVVNPGQTYRVTFNSEGSFFYHCNIHTFMQGVINVGNVGSTTTTAAASATVINPTTVEPGDSFTASAFDVPSANSGYVLRLGTSPASCPLGLALGGTRNSDASFNIPPTFRIIPTNATSGVRWLCWVRTGDVDNRSTPTSVTIV
ncbi:MAG: plastocyanin/azurin family copper-binding protein, partial [Acidimicrobiales bacterium]